MLAVVGVRSLHPRELYNQMYPVEALKRDAFRICNDANPTFIRAVWADREACYNSMPHVIAVALGRIRPSDAVAMAALSDPSRQAELLMMLASMPPRQPITAPRSFDNIAWLRALSPGCAEKVPPPVRYSGPAGLQAPASRTAALDSVVLGNLPPLSGVAKHGMAKPQKVPVIPLAPAAAAPMPPSPAIAAANPGADFTPLPTPDVGDKESPAIVPLAPASACGA
jgi:hypothetical protein